MDNARKTFKSEERHLLNASELRYICNITYTAFVVNSLLFVFLVEHNVGSNPKQIKYLATTFCLQRTNSKGYKTSHSCSLHQAIRPELDSMKHWRT